MNTEDIEDETLTKQQKKNKKKKEAAKKKKQQQKENVEEHKGAQDHSATQDLTDMKKEQESHDNFEEELCWCVQQLELGLKTQKPTKDQSLKNRKLIDQLKSTKTPKPKKRMLMKLNFDNYRDKMAKELKQYQQVEPTLLQAEDSIMKKSVYVKKKANELPACFGTRSDADVGFCFNFPEPT